MQGRSWCGLIEMLLLGRSHEMHVYNARRLAMGPGHGMEELYSALLASELIAFKLAAISFKDSLHSIMDVE